ncbi:uncharacterized protein LY89DRAFT_658401 [Mollisia scopiformis]|uniref:Heterokaryon incompatibility domain-containing protein n=1 Tax=Mollisia scopiformis TaxID=149040 RepID=A0A132B8I5_MOLSC|nr:uncharacterized protein LY89DRAFT_658401 [Mollisia scopiformis]KUJ08712.1 hypothetical protein LY89DRAFT_658401 [Mollisia scopiformis]
MSGSFALFIKRVEWYKWTIPVQGSSFRASRASCQLCHHLWHLLDERDRLRLAGPYIPRRQLPDALPWLWLYIWKHENGRYYLTLKEGDSSQPENSRNLCKAIKIREEKLNSQSASAHITIWTSDSFELAKTWLTDCKVGHKSNCSTGWEEDAPYLPARLLYVGENPTELHLQETGAPEFAVTDIKYLALSYCRSKLLATPGSQELTLNKKDEWKVHINENELPLTFQHAIHLARKLGFRYLWVDTICTIQDCPEDQKLASQYAGKVFTNAHCTIASPSEANEGFDDNNLNWQSRSFQERLLSRRIIHLGPKLLFFECSTHIASEAIPAGQPFRENRGFWQRRMSKPGNKPVPTLFDPIAGYRNSFHQLRDNRSKNLTPELEFFLGARWAELVYRFTSCRTTGPLDRRDAILGLVHTIQNGDRDFEYKQGLWRRHLFFDLLWSVESGASERFPGHMQRTRSWS